MILVKTELGHQVMKDRSVRLTPRQRSVFILCDGKRSAAEVLQASQGLQEDLDALLGQGLLMRQSAAAAVPAAPARGGVPDEADAPAASEPSVAAMAAPGGKASQERYKVAYPIATQLTAGLGLRGFRLNLAVEAATSWEELVGLLPKLRAAVGPDKAMPLERALIS